MGQPFRVEPSLPATARKTYRISRPAGTHWRDAACDEVGCPQHLHGWRTVLDETTEHGQAGAYYIRNAAGRRYTEHRTGPLATFTFEAGQQCFTAHRAELGRDPLYLVADGDWRGNPRGTAPRLHTAESWVDDFGTHQQTLADRLTQG